MIKLSEYADSLSLIIKAFLEPSKNLSILGSKLLFELNGVIPMNLTSVITIY